MSRYQTPVRGLLICLAALSAACSQDTPAPSASADGSAAAPPPVSDLRQPARAATAAPADPSTAAVEAGAADRDAAVTLEWDALIPADFRPDALLADLDLDNLSDDDPRAQAALDKIQALWDQAPVRDELDGQTVRLPGFVVPLEVDAEETSSFLLVPYYGACIHVPPPPANQTVYVVAQSGQGADVGLFEVVWVTGTMSVKRIANDMAEAGYTLYASQVAPYE